MSKDINKTNTHLEEALSDFISKISEDPNKNTCLLYTSPSPRDVEESRMPSSA